MLSVRSMIFQTFRSKNFFHALSTFVYVLSLGIVIQIPGIGEYFEGLRPLLFLSLLSALIFYMTGFNRKFIMFSVIYVFLFVSSSLIPMLQEELIPRKEIISGLLFGGGWLAFWSLIYHLGKTQHGFLRALLCGSANFFRLLALLLPMLLWGYYLVSGGYALSSAVLLTLFQTNWNESIAYMRSQDTLQKAVDEGVLGNGRYFTIVDLMENDRNHETKPGRGFCFFFLEKILLPPVSLLVGRSVLNDNQSCLCSYPDGHGNQIISCRLQSIWTKSCPA